MLFNVNTGVSTPVDQLVPPSISQQFGIAAAVGIDDRGDILVDAENLANQQDEMFMLTPPGLAPPTPTPEPSTLLFFGLIAGGIGAPHRDPADTCAR